MKWNDFLNPRSMLTPGVAGSVVMVIANTLWVEFLMPQKWTALVLSFLLIIPILIRFSASMIENIIYFLFNGLIVFALAVNANFAGGHLQALATDKKDNLAQLFNGFKEPLVSTAYAESKSQFKKINAMQLATNGGQQQDTTSTETQTQKQHNVSEQEKNKTKEKKNNEPKSHEQRKFFNQWF